MLHHKCLIVFENVFCIDSLEQILINENCFESGCMLRNLGSWYSRQGRWYNLYVLKRSLELSVPVVWYVKILCHFTHGSVTLQLIPVVRTFLRTLGVICLLGQMSSQCGSQK